MTREGMLTVYVTALDLAVGQLRYFALDLDEHLVPSSQPIDISIQYDDDHDPHDLIQLLMTTIHMT